jgi:hypothetical protein
VQGDFPLPAKANFFEVFTWCIPKNWSNFSQDEQDKRKKESKAFLLSWPKLQMMY